MRWLMLLLLGCVASGGGGSFATLSLAVDADPVLDVGASLSWTVRAISEDGASVDVTDRSTCSLGATGVGRLEDGAFVAEAPGVTELTCAFEGLQARISLTVRGEREARIADLRDLGVGSRVSVDAIVTAVDASETRVDFWAQDPGGGPFSGISIRDERAEEGAFPLAVGDRVRVTGTTSTRNGRAVLAMEGFEASGRDEVTIDRVDVASLSAERWDGCLVELEALEVTNADVDGYTWEVMDAAGDTLLVETLFTDPERTVGDVVERLVGIVYPFDDGTDRYLAVAPRGEDDLTWTRTETPVEPGDLRLADALDLASGTPVRFGELVITAVAPGSDGVTDFFASDPTGGPFAGAYFEDTRVAPREPLDLAVGDVVAVSGTFELWSRGMRAIAFDSLTVTGGASVVEPSPQSAGALDARWHGGLIAIEDVEVNEELSFGIQIVDRFGATLDVADELVALDDVRTGDRFDRVIGVLFVNRDGGMELWPRSSADLEAAR
jgi:hypothetical protein